MVWIFCWIRFKIPIILIAITEWYIPNPIIDEDTCHKIISLGEDFQSGEVGWCGDDKTSVEKDIRVSDVTRLPDCKWIVDLIVPLLESANINSGWKYDIKGMESLQLTRYRNGEFYNWHRDGFGDHLSGKQYGNDPIKYVRKLSMTLLLNDGYEGGQFQFVSYDKTECVISKPEFNKTGSLIVFPSFMEHRVTPVTKGTRYSLVGWFLGPPFR